MDAAGGLFRDQLGGREGCGARVRAESPAGEHGSDAEGVGVEDGEVAG